MSIGMVLNTAKLALAAQQQGLAVTSHNIANVNSPYYSRQKLLHNPTDPVSLGNVMIGTGVEVSAVTRYCDQLLENRLIDLKSDLAANEETAGYLGILESAFSENTENGISHIMSEFWNTWHDLSNNPTGEPERQAVYEKGVHLSERLDTLTNDLLQIENDINNEISAVISQVGTIGSQLADINNQILGLEGNKVAHDLLDQRNALLNEMGELVDINAFELADGSMSVVTAGGFDLVVQADYRSLTFESSRVMWESSQGATIDITDKLTGGKIKGWLEMRDEILSKYQAELDGLTKEFAWTVNYQHSQGVGKQFATSAVTGTYATDSSEMLATLDFGHKIDHTEDFKMYVNTSGSNLYPFVNVDMAISDAVVSTWAGTGDADRAYRFTVTKAGTVGAGTDDPIVAWEKINSAGTVTGSGNIVITDVDTFTADPFDGTLTFNIAAGSLVAGNTFTINTDAGGDINANSLTLNPTGTANSILDNYKFTVSSTTGDGVVGTDTIVIDWSNSFTNGSFTLDATNTATVDGMTLTFGNGGIFADNDAFTIETDSTGSPTAHMMSDWHWTLDSFTDQFNREATAAGMGVTAAKTSDDKITFTPGANNSIAFPGSYTIAEVTSSDGALVDATTMDVLGVGELTLNGTAIRAAVAGDDTVSSSDKAGSAIATADAINASASTTGVRAYAEKTTFDMGAVATLDATLLAGEITINGIATTTGGNVTADAAGAVVLAGIINNIQGSTGVVATVTGGGSDEVTLTAVDGRNIQIQSSGDADLVMDNFDFTAVDDDVIRGNVSLYSDSAITIAGTLPTDVGFSATTTALATSTDSGLAAALGINTFFDGVDAQTIGVNSVLKDRAYIAAAQLDPVTGDFGVGDSRNAIAIADLQYSATNIGKWTYSRGSDATTTLLSISLENYYQSMVGSIGIESAEFTRSVKFSEVFLDKITEQRDNLSAVSLDEEMISLMKYQHAYSVASKLLTVADDLLLTLINSKR